MTATVNVHDAKTHFSRLLERAKRGETIIIAKAGEPVAQLTPLPARAPATKRRLGFMKGVGTVPDDIKTPYADEIEELFYGKP